MANPAKAKGDKGERDAVVDLVELAPDLVSKAKPDRYRGAGRADDVGDIRVFDDVAIQVKVYADPASIISGSATGAKRQQGHKTVAEGYEVPYHLGMVKVPRAQPGTVKWIATGLDYPKPGVRTIVAPTYKDAIKLIRLNPRVVFIVEKSGKTPLIFMTSIERWITDYRENRTPLAHETSN